MSLFSVIRSRARRETDWQQLRKRIKGPLPIVGVPGEGKWRNPEAMLIQDRPGGGYMQGLFARRAGTEYQRILDREGIDINDCYITSALKTKPGIPRPSIHWEMKFWRDVLQREIQLVRPKKIILIGGLTQRVVQDLRELRKDDIKGLST